MGQSKSEFEGLEALRDELRVKVHLASMDLRDRWHTLSKEADKLTRDAERTSKQAWTKLVSDFKQLARDLQQP